MKTTVVRFALRSAGILIILGLINWFAVSKTLGYRASEVVGYLSMILALSTIYFAIRHFRAEFGNGFVSFGQALRIGTLISLIVGGIFCVYTIIFFLVWGNDFKEYATSHFQSTLSAEEYQQFLVQMQQPLWSNPVFQGFVMFVTVFLIGFIVTLISAMVLKRSA